MEVERGGEGGRGKDGGEGKGGGGDYKTHDKLLQSFSLTVEVS